MTIVGVLNGNNQCKAFEKWLKKRKLRLLWGFT